MNDYALIAALALIFVSCLMLIVKRIRDDRRSREAAGKRPLRPAFPAPGAQSDPAPLIESADPFLAAVAKARDEVGLASRRELEAHKSELAAKYDEDMALKARLSAYVKETGLDRALLTVWDEVRSYPAWSKRPDFSAGVKMGFSEISGETTDGIETVLLVWQGTQYTFKSRSWQGHDGTSYKDIAVAEETIERLAVSATVIDGLYVNSYGHVSVNAFHKEGTWPAMLFKCDAAVRLRGDMSMATAKYHAAGEIKERFKE